MLRFINMYKYFQKLKLKNYSKANISHFSHKSLKPKQQFLFKCNFPSGPLKYKRVGLWTEQATIIYKDDEVVIFNDIHPASKHHFLVIPKEHIINAKQLTKDQIPLVESLIRHGERVIREIGGDIKDTRFGFHWPPFNSVSHLHLHAIFPASQMSLISKLIFKEGTLWFVNPHYVLKRLAKL